MLYEVITLHLGRDALEDGLHARPRLGVAAGHDRRPEQGALLAAGDARADEQESGFAEISYNFV